ncbi:Coenzyme F420 hydrogenase/dehydrogenase, beta subunit C-terminal domain [Agromyces atrinae]|uniref:Coenzyme F420 hydrogenase n=1 Tax=Agromyces atrinae TaxID=592376 RepID=A0A4V1R247_9MICO|nr:Coenzyme F420 hydrogenase/dehydrogenase, beta subunit C-terminal domain [Agromyces atrinae]NYD68510.1 coenzyme F420 hydrogenase subunit beta [Agromyces atrinae]RXZ85896.1 coenzyme F420 hydrogenase [Agromyces atrinae]
MSTGFERAVEKVVREGNCSGCGGCSMLSNRVEMRLRDGFMRPQFTHGALESERNAAAAFREVCPGRSMRAPDAGEFESHPTFGRYVSAWRAVAVDDEVRHRGSSAGVLTALSTFIVEQKLAPSVAGAAASAASPTRTVPVTILTRNEALAAAGSRYAPVSVLRPDLGETTAVVGKPCEISALRRVRERAGQDEAAQPLTLSFFCAGVPSQDATNRLIVLLGADVDDVTDLAYRGDGWPGYFRVNTRDSSERLSYEESWGAHLGKDLQWRCKVCPDGTGADADVAVGDYWQADERGFPVFENTAGVSVAIARTSRGHALLLRAAAEGAIRLEPIDLEDVARIQPLQVTRKRTLLGRLVGRRVAGRSIPSMKGYRLIRLAKPYAKKNLQAARGTFERSLPRRVRAMARRVLEGRGKDG